MAKRNDIMTDEEIKKELDKGKIVIRERGFSFYGKFRQSLLIDAFNRKNKCRRCGKTQDIQIHHIYSTAPKDVIDTYEDFCKIFWIPLCKLCHMEEHEVEPPDETEDD